MLEGDNRLLFEITVQECAGSNWLVKFLFCKYVIVRSVKVLGEKVS